VAFGVNHLDHGVRTVEVIDGNDSTNTTAVLSTSDGSKSVVLELGNFCDLARLEIVHNGVTSHDRDIQETKVVSIVCVSPEYSLLTRSDLVDLEKLELCLVILDRYHLEAALGVIEETPVLLHLWNREDVLETSGITLVSSWLTIDQDVLVADHHSCLAHVASKPETVADNECKWKTLRDTVWALRWSWGINATHLIKHPVGWSIQSFHVQTWTTSLLC
jgi:hypothetical protein